MFSKWSHLKSEVSTMRKGGASIREIELALGIPRSTLSGWIRTIPISLANQKNLELRHRQALVIARVKAADWHREQKTLRIAKVHDEAQKMLSRINVRDPEFLEIALAFLYLGEGSKKSIGTSLGNSNPMILRFFIAALRSLYNIEIANIKCDLHLRADQSAQKEITYWSKALQLPIQNFCKPVIDMRTSGSATYPDYHGVCAVRCSRVAIQRRLMYIATMFCDKLTE